MVQYTRIWSFLREGFFIPHERKWHIWVGFAPLLQELSMGVLLLHFSPLLGFIALISLLPFLFLGKLSLSRQCISASLFFLFSLFLFFRSTTVLGSLEWMWLFTTFSSSILMIFSIQEGREYVEGELEEKQEIENERKLWQARFETIKERLEKERELLEGENAMWMREIEEKKEHIASLRRLALAMQKAIQTKPQEAPSIHSKEEVEALKKQMQEMQAKIEGQEEVKRKRRERNETLLATSGKGSIVLKDLAKGLK